jgi:hypothetical protein
MTIEEYKDEILMSLGAPIVQIEIKDYIPQYINRAFRELKRYISTPHFVTVPYTGAAIDLTSYNVYSVINVMRSQPTYGTFIQDADVFTLASSYYNMNNIDNYVNRMAILQQRNTLATDLDFIWNSETKQLFISTNPPFPPALTIQYTKEYTKVDDIKDPYWTDLLLRLAIAYSKQALGRVRGKYTLNSAQYNLDGETLINEANTEIENIRTHLITNCDVVYPID